MTELSIAQKTIATHYGAGDYAYLAELSQEEVDEKLKTERDSFGDTLFTFLMIECSPSEDCDSTSEAYRRMECAIENIRDCMEEL